MFKGVKLTADGPGSYVLRAASASRKVAVADAAVTVEVRPRAGTPLGPNAAAECTEAGSASAS